MPAGDDDGEGSGMTDDYAKRRLAELHTAAPARRKKIEPYAKVKLGAAAQAFTAMNSPKAMVWVWLMHQTRKTGKRTVPVPNGALAKLGVGRDVKRVALKQLEAARLIVVERPLKKTPVVTLS
jgi:hypothetical protein